MRRGLIGTVAFGLAAVGLMAVAGRAYGDEAPECLIVYSPDAWPTEILAARELQRYLYLRTGTLVPVTIDVDAAHQARIVVGRRGRSVVERADAKRLHPSEVGALRVGEYFIRTLDADGKRTVLIVGGDTSGALLGAYRYAEHLGMRFYLDGDVAPESLMPLQLPEVNEKGFPLFEFRGIQPFHDFPEGPDWWDEDGYKAVIGQLPKMGMNFIGFHTYPEGGVGPEPLVWIGRPSDVNPDGTVKSSYPSRHFSTANGTWGYQAGKPQGYGAKRTIDYRCGAAMLYERDPYAQDVQLGMCPWPETPEQQNELFDKFGAKLRRVFEYARSMGIKTCVGTEVPLTIPKLVRERIVAGRPTTQPTADDVQELYQGIFTRIMLTYPLDYYWFWTPEHWTWKNVSEEEVKATLEDIHLAITAAQKVSATFRLATCGWVLGPQYNRALFNDALPEGMPLSCINRAVGHDPVEPAFEKAVRWDKWAIPWLEDDPAMIIPQLWAGRMRKDAKDALKYACSGLMGIHWRTRILGPNVSAMAQATWDQSAWRELEPIGEKQRFMPADDFWQDWAKVHFGFAAGPAIGEVFARMDGKLPRPSDWVNGPGGIKADKRPWAEASKDYAFVDELEALRPTVKGVVSLDRYDWWLNQMRYLRAVGQVSCLSTQLNELMAALDKEKDEEARKRLAAEKALPLRKELIAAVKEVYGLLLATVGNTGEMGTITNWEQHLFPTLLEEPGEKLAKALGVETLPADARLGTEYEGRPRMFVRETRANLLSTEKLTLKVVVLDGKPAKEVTAYWRALGTGKYEAVAGKHEAKGGWTVILPAAASAKNSFEYYVTGVTDGGTAIQFPAGAPKVTQSVVVMPWK